MLKVFVYLYLKIFIFILIYLENYILLIVQKLPSKIINSVTRKKKFDVKEVEVCLTR